MAAYRITLGWKEDKKNDGKSNPPMWPSVVTQEAYTGSCCPEKCPCCPLNAKDSEGIRFIWHKTKKQFLPE